MHKDTHCPRCVLSFVFTSWATDWISVTSDFHFSAIRGREQSGAWPRRGECSLKVSRRKEKGIFYFTFKKCYEIYMLMNGYIN